MKPISKILEILTYKNRSDLARLLKNCNYRFNESSTFGSRYFSVLTTVEIFSSITQHEKLIELTQKDINDIVDAFHIIYPIRDNDIEINDVEFFVDPDAPIPINKRSVSKLKDVDFEYISEQIEKCDEKISIGDFEGAITNSRTLIETVCKYILDSQQISYSKKNDLPMLYKKVSEVLRMDPSIYEVKSFKEILSGSFSIINGISNVRNELGDAHGKSINFNYRPSGRHAILAVNISKTISDYLYSSFIEKIKK